MRKIILLLVGIAVLGSGSKAWAQEVSAEIRFGNGSDQIVLQFGLAPSASSSIDAALGEVEFPPLPPGQVFDARFISGSLSGVELGNGALIDLREGSDQFEGVLQHEISLQWGTYSSIEVSWSFPEGVEALLLDPFGGQVLQIALRESGTRTITNSALTTLRLDAHYNLTASGVGVEEIQPANTLSHVYPNPTHGTVRVSEGAQIMGVYDVQGRLQAVNKLQGSRMSISLDALPRGVYFIRLNTSGSESFQTVIKQ